MKFVIRQVQDQDKPFIFNSWLESYRSKSNFTKDIPKYVYFKFHGKLIEQVLSRKTSITLIAISDEEPDIILGYLVSEVISQYDILHYVYVKQPFRHLGLSKLLTEALPFQISKKTYISHMTEKAKKIVHKMNLIYAPYLI